MEPLSVRSSDVHVKVSPPRGRGIRTMHMLSAEPPALLAGFVALVLGGLIILGALKQHLGGDFQSEVILTRQGLHTGVFPGNFLLYALTALLAGFSTNRFIVDLSFAAVLAMAIAAKGWVSARYAIAEDAKTSASHAKGRELVLVVAAASLCAVAFSLPGTTGVNYYLGQIPANVWHNGTTILLMPFAVGLFWISLNYLRTPKTKYLWWSLPVAAVGIAAKPSFATCFLAIFPLAALVRYKFTKETLRAWYLAAAIGVALALQYVYVYVIDPAGSRDGVSTGVQLAPFKVWGFFLSSHAVQATSWPTTSFLPVAVPVAILSSYAFPIVALLLGGRSLRSDRGVQYALALALVGLAEYALLAERGTAFADGNYTWAAIVTQYTLFLATITAFVSTIRVRGWGVGQLVIALVFATNIGAGVFYIIHWFTTKSFL